MLIAAPDLGWVGPMGHRAATADPYFQSAGKTSGQELPVCDGSAAGKRLQPPTHPNIVWSPNPPVTLRCISERDIRVVGGTNE
jgi:hypothetical protein